MTKRQAREEGLIFTGHYENYFERNKLKTIAQILRKLYKCRVVMVEEECGVSLYADEKYDALHRLEYVQNMLKHEAKCRAEVEERYRQELKELNNKYDNFRSEVEAISEKYPEFAGVEVQSVYDYMREHNIEV